ncbi:hypothetical protein [Flavobacterium aquidurense]|uniref:ATP-binding region ATPase domain protein n=1 Tax=Flavobacterium aquidurense TaxID=362413 RepID=A0A0Q0RMQ8_9FLAO|nr:hypothetical protein [Flavobacterium aquidurense]KQB37275.1 ATP-binding region ATPase domain protein [Flavobacterium aquidurense]
MKKLSKTLSVNDFEELYSELYSSKSPFDLVLPSSLKSLDFGITTLLIQYINTWFRLKSGNLILDVRDDLSDLEDIVKQDYIFPSLIMSWDRGIFDRNKNNIKSSIRPFNEQIIESMQSLENIPLFNKTFIRQKGLKSLLTCFDHLPPEKGYLDCFYLNQNFIPSEEYLSNSLEDTLDYVLSFNSKGKQNTKPIKNDLVSIIFELMKNTHDWARKDNKSITLRPNTRGLFIKFLKGSKESYTENYRDHKGLKTYFDSLIPNTKNEIYFIEISVFDSGIGFVKKYTSSNEDVEIDRQVKIIKQCLVKHNTSDKSLEKENKGIGLDKIMQILNHKGLFIIRTSNAFVFRNMKKDPHIVTNDEEDIELYDWYTSSNKSFTKFTECVGSNITIVYPIIIANE